MADRTEWWSVEALSCPVGQVNAVMDTAGLEKSCCTQLGKGVSELSDPTAEKGA